MFELFLVISLAISLCILYQLTSHYNWWLGFFDTFSLIIFHHRRVAFSKKNMTASDGEQYTVWTPKNQEKSKNKHIWICLPGGMESIDPGFCALIYYDVFKGSELCMFNNPGIKTIMNNKPLISPTETFYLMEYIKYLHNNGYKISLLGFSVGSVQAMRTLHTLSNSKTDKIKLQSVVLVHAPDIVREAIESFQNNWIVRMDIYFSFHIRLLHHLCNSWNMIKDKINNSKWYDGWSFIQEATEMTLEKDWNFCEREMFNLRNFCDESITNVPTMRIISQNDWIVPYRTIDSSYFRYLTKVLITKRGGHCAVNVCNKTLNHIKEWNEKYCLSA